MKILLFIVLLIFSCEQVPLVLDDDLNSQFFITNEVFNVESDSVNIVENDAFPREILHSLVINSHIIDDKSKIIKPVGYDVRVGRVTNNGIPFDIGEFSLNDTRLLANPINPYLYQLKKTSNIFQVDSNTFYIITGRKDLRFKIKNSLNISDSTFFIKIPEILHTKNFEGKNSISIKENFIIKLNRKLNPKTAILSISTKVKSGIAEKEGYLNFRPRHELDKIIIPKDLLRRLFNVSNNDKKLFLWIGEREYMGNISLRKKIGRDRIILPVGRQSNFIISVTMTN